MITLTNTTDDEYEKVMEWEVTGGKPTEYFDECYTLAEDDNVLAVFGGFHVIPGYTRVFVGVTEVGSKRPITLFKALKKFLELGSPRYNRMEATVRADFPKGIRLLEKLGFEHEGLMHNYDPVDLMDHHVMWYRTE